MRAVSRAKHRFGRKADSRRPRNRLLSWPRRGGMMKQVNQPGALAVFI